VSAIAIGLPIVVRFIRERPESTGTRRVLGGASVGEALQSRVFWILVAVLFSSSIAQNGAITHMAALLTDRGVAAGEAALAVSAMGAASLAGRFATGWMLDRFFAARVSIALLLIAASGTFVLAYADSLAAGALGAALIGFGMGGEADVTPYMLSRYYGLRSFATLYGLTWTAYAVAGAIGPILMGRVFDLTGSYETLLVRLSLVIAAIAALNFFVPRPSPALTELQPA
jgi:cyanate permease